MTDDDRAIAGFTMLGHALFHAYELAVPVFVVVWLSAFDLTAAGWGVIVGASFGLVGLGSPISGVLADRHGSKTLVTISGVGMGAAFFLMALLGTLWSIVVGLLLWGVAASIYHPAGLSLISRGATQRGRVLAYHGAAGSVGTVVGPLITIVLLAVADWRTASAALALPSFGLLLAGALLSFETRAGVRNPTAAPSSPREFLADSRALFVGGFAVVFTIQMVYGMYYRGIFTFLPDVLASLQLFPSIALGGHELDSGQLAYSGLLLVGVFGQYAGGILSDRIQPELALVPIFLVLVAASLLFIPASIVGIAPLLVVCALLGFFIYAFAPVGQSLVAEYVPPGKHGLSFGFTYLGTFGVGALGASLAGATLAYADERLLFLVLAVLVTICGIISGYLYLTTTAGGTTPAAPADE
ncbi:MFS transporter [Haloferacaceae archaeon DSL9]